MSRIDVRCSDRTELHQECDGDRIHICEQWILDPPALSTRPHHHIVPATRFERATNGSKVRRSDQTELRRRIQPTKNSGCVAQPVKKAGVSKQSSPPDKFTFELQAVLATRQVHLPVKLPFCVYHCKLVGRQKNLSPRLCSSCLASSPCHRTSLSSKP